MPWSERLGISSVGHSQKRRCQADARQTIEPPPAVADRETIPSNEKRTSGPNFGGVSREPGGGLDNRRPEDQHSFSGARVVAFLDHVFRHRCKIDAPAEIPE